MMETEQSYIRKRIWMARLQSIPFYLCRIFSVRKKKIVFCCIEGTTGYSCNPKYIARELLRRNAGYELVWLVNDVSKRFPAEIKVIRNTLWKRAYALSTAHFWIDNSRKQLECRKRKGQVYIQTWHAKLGFKPTCLDRGASFSRIAYLVSKHDSDMIDYVLSNSKWYDDTLSTGMLYHGEILRSGSPRCDILVRAKNDRQFQVSLKEKIRKHFRVSCKEDVSQIHFLMYAPTFRGGSQETVRSIAVGQNFLDYGRLVNAMEQQFGGKWYILLRLHPQLVARNMDKKIHLVTNEDISIQGGNENRIVDVSRVEDMYPLLAGCEAFMTDYSSAAFDAAVMEIPVFLYADDYEMYEKERGSLLWDLRKLPFPLAQDDEEMERIIREFDLEKYRNGLKTLFRDTEMTEDGTAAAYVAGWIEKMT